MSDSKYGSLFTEDDVLAIVDAALHDVGALMDDDVIRELIAEHSGRFLDDEPLFLLRGRDRLAPEAVRAYSEAVHRDDATTVEMGRSVEKALARLVAWQERSPDLVRTPTVSSSA